MVFLRVFAVLGGLVVALVVVVIDPPAVFDYDCEDDEEDDWRPALFRQLLSRQPEAACGCFGLRSLLAWRILCGVKS
jgi:hypothetical protein